eukprot:6191841-Pleurochrysis_carterae.AAC.1
MHACARAHAHTQLKTPSARALGRAQARARLRARTAARAHSRTIHSPLADQQKQECARAHTHAILRPCDSPAAIAFATPFEIPVVGLYFVLSYLAMQRPIAQHFCFSPYTQAPGRVTGSPMRTDECGRTSTRIFQASSTFGAVTRRSPSRSAGPKRR